MELSQSILGMGAGAGFVAVISVFFVQLEYAGPFMRVFLVIFGLAGVLSTIALYQRTQARLQRYERVLREHGVDPSAI